MPSPQLTGVRSLSDLVAYCARVSNPDNQINHETDEKLIKYLMNHDHWSPLEMVNVCLEINTTRDIGRQIIRHRSFSFQEFSQRYAEVTSQPEIRECRFQDAKNRQSSTMPDPDQDQAVIEEWRKRQEDSYSSAQDHYSWAIKNNIAKEQARVVLPEGNTGTRLYMNGSLRSWVHYIALREGNGTQKEHKLLALECKEIISKIYPFL